ncbi:MAG: DUF3857 domain-containing transglutaminase family protein [Deltaproteobacteria bacterium]|nr:DUF3857 domain-containing transglutaminase family protein [Deltaproteobacteria bacterium]
MKIFVLLGLGAFLGSLPAAHARWATPDDSEWATESYKLDIDVRKDGTFKSTTESLNTILRDGARSMSNYRLGYNSRASKFKVLEASTINQGTTFQVDSEFIEDKPQASRLSGFDQMNLVVIAFPKVQIGSMLHVKYVEEHKEVPFPNHYSARFEFGHNWNVKKYDIHLRSEMPLKIEKNDPQGKLEIVQSKKSDDEYELTVKLKSPLYTHAIDEPWPSTSQKDVTWVVVSSAKDYAELGDSLAEKYDAVVNAELPPSYQKILEAAKTKKTMVERLNTITSELNTEVRYMGDWRPIAGGHVPRPLEVVAKTKFGDCKDFASGTVAILRKLGVTADVAWVERSTQPSPLPPLAYTGAFNHAIVWARAEGREWWIDPTNFASFAQGIFTDIIDRKALIVEPKASRLGTIPAGLAQDSLRENSSRVTLEPSGDAKIEAVLNFKGRGAAGYTGALMKQSKDHVDHAIITALVEENRLKWSQIDAYDLNSRVTADFNIKLRWEEQRYSMRTTVGPAFYLGQQDVDHLIRLETKKRVSDLFQGHPDIIQDTDFVDNIKLLGQNAPECSIDSPWVKVSRKITQTAHGLKIVDRREVKTSLIKIEELKSPAFEKFQKNLQKCFDRVAVVYAPLNSLHPRAISSENIRQK